MAKNIYLGVDGKARKMKKAYLGVDGKAHEIKKIYLGVDGKARLAYTNYVALTDISISWSIDDPYWFIGVVEEGRATFIVTLVPEDATEQTFSWTVTGAISDSGTRTGSTGISVTATAAGTSYLTVTIGNIRKRLKIVTKQTYVYSGNNPVGKRTYCVDYVTWA